MGNSEPAPGNHQGICEKLFHAFSNSPAVRRSITFRQNQEDLGKGKFAGLGSKAKAAPTAEQVKEIVITGAEKVAAVSAPAMPGTMARHVSHNSSQRTEKTAPSPVSSVKDINYKVENYINRMKSKFMD